MSNESFGRVLPADMFLWYDAKDEGVASGRVFSAASQHTGDTAWLALICETHVSVGVIRVSRMAVRCMAAYFATELQKVAVMTRPGCAGFFVAYAGWINPGNLF